MQTPSGQPSDAALPGRTKARHTGNAADAPDPVAPGGDQRVRADRVEGTDFYHRAMRAHANCVENLPVFAAIVLSLHAAGAVDRTTGFVWLAVAVLAGFA